MIRFILAGSIAALTCSAAQADNVYYFPAPVMSSGQPGVRAVLPIGTTVMMRTLTQISTKDNKPGDRVYLEVAENVMAGNQIVIPVGSPVTAEVAATQRNGHFGKKGKIELQLREVQTPSGPVRLMGSSNDEGVSGTVASIATFVLVSPLGFLIHGTSAYIPSGTPVQGQTVGDLKYTYYPDPSANQKSAQASNTGLPKFNF